MTRILEVLEDMVDDVGSIFNLILCVFIAGILSASFMVLIACMIAILR